MLARALSLPRLDGSTALSMIRASVESGLGTLASRLLDALGLSGADPAQVTLLRRAIESAPSGLERPEITLARAEANFAHLASRQPQMRPLLPELRAAAGSILVLRSRRGHVLVLGRSGAFAPLIPFAVEAPRAEPDEESALHASLLFGTPSLPLWQALLVRQPMPGYLPPIDIVEPDVHRLSAWLCAVDCAPSIASGRLALFSGSGAWDLYAEHLQRHASRALPVRCMLMPGARDPGPMLAERLTQIVQHRRSRQEELARRGAEQAASVTTSMRAERFEAALRGEARLRVVAFTSRFTTVLQHAMRDLARAFESFGAEFSLVMQADDSTSGVDVAGKLAEASADLIIVINHLRHEYANAIPASIPFVGWIQDDMLELASHRAGASVDDRELVLSPCPGVLEHLYGYPAQRLMFSSNLTSAATFAAAPPKDEREEIDIAFISHGGAPVEVLIERLSAGNARLHTLMACFAALVREELARTSGASLFRLVELMLHAERESHHPPLSPDARRNALYPQLLRVYDRIFRHEAIHWCAEWAKQRGRSLALFGREWEAHPDFARFARGEVANGDALRLVHQRTRITIQANGYGSLHQRLLDALAAGGFVLTRWNPGDFFRAPLEVIAKEAETAPSLAHLIARIESHEPLRRCRAELERLSSLIIAPVTDPRRQAQIDVMRQANDVRELQTDEGLRRSLAHMSFAPLRTAGDLPGFEATTFRSLAQCHELLDQFVDDSARRRELAEPMRRDVLDHDTFEALAEKLMRYFAELLRAQADGQAPTCTG